MEVKASKCERLSVYSFKEFPYKSFRRFTELKKCFMPAPTALNNQVPSGQLVSQKPIVLWFHDTGTFANHDAVVNPEYFPNIRDGQLLRIHAPHSAFVVKASCVDRESLARQQNLQISVSKDIAERFNLRFRIEVYVELASKKNDDLCFDIS